MQFVICNISTSHLAANRSNTFQFRTFILKVRLTIPSSKIQVYNLQLLVDLFKRGGRSSAGVGLCKVCRDEWWELCIKPWCCTVEGFPFCPQQHCHHLVALVHAATTWKENVRPEMTAGWRAAREATIKTCLHTCGTLQNTAPLKVNCGD